jgi:hypothetical protein
LAALVAQTVELRKNGGPGTQEASDWEEIRESDIAGVILSIGRPEKVFLAVFAPPIKAVSPTGPLRQLSRRAEAPTSGKSDDLRAQEGGRSLSWDFSKIPVFAARPTPHQTPHPIIQPKLVVGPVDDPLEHEADHVADQVMGMPEPGRSVSAGPPQLSRKCADCEEEDKLRRNPSGGKLLPARRPN